MKTYTYIGNSHIHITVNNELRQLASGDEVSTDILDEQKRLDINKMFIVNNNKKVGKTPTNEEE